MSGFNNLKTCLEITNDKKLKNPSGERNKEPILEAIKQYIDINSTKKLLEISSGTGLHSSFFAGNFLSVTFQPTEYNVNLFQSIREYSKDFPENILEPIQVDISKHFDELDPLIKNEKFDYILNINMIHISPIECTHGLFANSSKLLHSNGLLFTYGPYAVNGVLIPESNIRFNNMLKSDNPSWGIRDLKDLEIIAKSYQIELVKVHDLPANNKFVVWKKT